MGPSLLSNGYVSIRAPTNKLSHAPRPLSVKHGNVEIAIVIPGGYWAAAEQLREQFLFSLAHTPGVAEADSQSPQDQQQESEEGEWTGLELAARFLKFSIERASSQDSETADVFFEVTRLIFLYVRERFLQGNDVHVVANELLTSETAINTVINAYVTALTVLRARATTRPVSPTFMGSASTKAPVDEVRSVEEEDVSLVAPSSALFVAAQERRAGLFAIFGGQGTSVDYFNEAHDIFHTYEPLLRPFVKRMSEVLHRYATDENSQTLHSKGLDVLGWLQHPATQPDDEYLVSAPVSPPLIGLIQLMHYVVLCRMLDLTPGQVRQHFIAATGHSQGVISAAVIAASDSWESFYANAEKGLGLLFWLGTRAQQVFPATTLNPAMLQDSLSNNEGTPSPMLSISHLRYADVVQHVKLTNSHLPADRHIRIALVNGPRSCVCTGPPQSLYGLNLRLRKLKAPSGVDQSRVPFSKRQLKIATRFLPITVPFHSDYLQAATDLIAQDIERCDLHLHGNEMTIPLLSTDEGVDMRSVPNLSLSLIEQAANKTAYWERSTDVPQVTHILDFGPGGLSGIGALTYRNKEGTGVQVVFVGALTGNRKNLDYKPALFDTRPEAVRYSPNWARDFRPKLVRTSCNDQLHIATRMSELLGKPPLMVAGMTPTTVSGKFVSAVLNAGYHIELAGGGHYNEKALRRKIRQIMQDTQPGLGITLNILYLNARQWAFQFPLVQTMRREGLPIEGVCVAAGVPALDVANDIVRQLQAAGIRHVAFKPSSVATIMQVVAIAHNNPTMPIILQWTGGRAGGHHSYEDFHQPIINTYGAIREHKNLVLVAGSGFGGAEDTLPYLTGDWSVAFDYPPMPFDGILFGSRMMVALESESSLATKQAIVDAPGIAQDAEWEQTYEKPTGGVVTVNSELGEPIHKIATRGIMFWKELDETIFNLPRDKRLPALLAKKDYIIKRLNADFQKVWFGRKKDGQVADLPEMTYEEVVDRLVDLMYIRKEDRWIDVTQRNLVGDFIRRLEERFTRTARASVLQDYQVLDHPHNFLSQTLWPTLPEARDQLLTSEDVLYFITLCKRRGQKPVPFIPVLDKDFDVWFKKDSLWQSEDLAAVVDEDVQRTCILQGPMAAYFSTKVNEPAGEILGNIYQGHIAALQARDHGTVPIPTIEYLGSPPAPASLRLPRSVHVAHPTPTTRELSIPFTTDQTPELPSIDTWLELIAGADHGWLRALLTASIVVQDQHYIDNPMRRVLAPRQGQLIQLTYDRSAESESQAEPTVVGADGASVPSATLGPCAGRVVQFIVTQLDKAHTSPFVAIQAVMDPTTSTVEFTLNERQGTQAVPLNLYFRYTPEHGYAPVHEVMEGRNERIKAFYYHLWFGHRNVAELDVGQDHKFIAPYEPVESTAITKFCQAVGNQAELYVDRGQKVVNAPVDFAIVVGWKAIIKAIFPQFIDGDLLKLVHLSNGFRMVNNAPLLRDGDVVDTVATLQAVVNTDSGKMVEVLGTVVRDGEPVMEVTSQFLYRGHFTDYEHTFRRTKETPIRVTLETTKDLAVLKAKEWIEWGDTNVTSELTTPCVLEFRLNTFTQFRDRTAFAKVHTTGSVTMLTSTKVYVQVATVNYQASESHGNPVMSYLERVGEPMEQPYYFDNGGYSVMPTGEEFSSVVNSPASNEAYARVSGDFNPIHVNPYFADLAQLPGTITHGMWTSASTRKFVETFAADNHPQRVTAYHVNFQGMVLPSDRLETKLSHIGMQNGKKIIKVETVNQDDV
ncbi:fatty acid synthase alpha subunit Lsd1, partial [Dimargaris xerosporica]